MRDLHNKLRTWTGVGDTGGIQRNRDLMLQASDRIRELECRIAQLERRLDVRNRQLAILWDVLARNERMLALANETMAALAREAT